MKDLDEQGKGRKQIQILFEIYDTNSNEITQVMTGQRGTAESLSSKLLPALLTACLSNYNGKGGELKQVGHVFKSEITDRTLVFSNNEFEVEKMINDEQRQSKSW